jgi:hypothetical protein
MAREIKRIEVTAHLSRHNDEQDQADDDLFATLTREVAAVARQEKYRHMDINIDSEGI